MKIFYLAGNAPHNRGWIEEVKKHFDTFSEGEILYYDHWQSGKEWIDLETELKKLKEMVKDETDYFIFAKSIGTILALKAIDEKIIFPKANFLCGLPYKSAKELNLPIDNYLESLKIPTIFVQNEFDPVASYKEIEKVFSKHKPEAASLFVGKGKETHDYVNFGKMADYCRSLFQAMEK